MWVDVVLRKEGSVVFGFYESIMVGWNVRIIEGKNGVVGLVGGSV